MFSGCDSMVKALIKILLHISESKYPRTYKYVTLALMPLFFLLFMKWGWAIILNYTGLLQGLNESVWVKSQNRAWHTGNPTCISYCYNYCFFVMLFRRTLLFHMHEKLFGGGVFCEDKMLVATNYFLLLCVC